MLLNGKRVHRSALVQVNGASLSAGAQGADLSQIPSAAIERIEVLRDGAAAQYGSDAIAGVINFGLKRNAKGLSLAARYGQYYEGDANDAEAGAVADYDAAIRIFQHSQGLPVTGWKASLLARFANAASLNGRDRLRDALVKLGFPLC